MPQRTKRAFTTIMTIAALTVGLTSCSKSTPTKTVASCSGGVAAPARTVAWNTIYANVYNASTTKGQAAKVAQHLQWRGLNILDVKNDPLADELPAPKYAEIRYGKAGKTIAENVALQIPHATLRQDDRTDPTIDIVIGDHFSLTPRPPAAIQDTTVHVYNTTFMAGLASKVANDLRGRGFKVDDKPNDKAYYPNDTAVIVYDEQGLPQAQRLQLNIQGARLLQDTKAGVDIKGTDVNLYLGSKWPTEGQLVPQNQATPSPTASPSPCK